MKIFVRLKKGVTRGALKKYFWFKYKKQKYGICMEFNTILDSPKRISMLENEARKSCLNTYELIKKGKELPKL